MIQALLSLNETVMTLAHNQVIQSNLAAYTFTICRFKWGRVPPDPAKRPKVFRILSAQHKSCSQCPLQATFSIQPKTPGCLALCPAGSYTTALPTMSLKDRDVLPDAYVRLSSPTCLGSKQVALSQPKGPHVCSSAKKGRLQDTIEVSKFYTLRDSENHY